MFDDVFAYANETSPVGKDVGDKDEMRIRSKIEPRQLYWHYLVTELIFKNIPK